MKYDKESGMSNKKIFAICLIVAIVLWFVPSSVFGIDFGKIAGDIINTGMEMMIGHKTDDSGNVAQTKVSGDYTYTAWDERESPNYYRIDGAAIVGYDVESGEIRYGDLDRLGRATYAVGKITKDIYTEELNQPREQSLPKSTGYRNYYVGDNPAYNTKIIGKGIGFWNGYTYTGAFYNRSHLIADSLGGEPSKKNLITGTRCQNTGTNNAQDSGYGGMAYPEETVRKYFKRNYNDATDVYYAVTPVYEGDELLPRSVFVDVKSEDGKIDMHIETYNCAKGYEIDYGTGIAKASK